MAKKDRKRKVTPEMKERMKKLRDEELTYQKISDKLDLSYSTVYNYLKEKEGKKGKPRFLERPVGRIISISIAAAVLIIAIVGYYFLNEGRSFRIGYETYVNENYSFKFDYPADWILNERTYKNIENIPTHENIPPLILGLRYSLVVRENVSENEIGGVMSLLVREMDLSLENFTENFISFGEFWATTDGPIDSVVDGLPAVKYLLKSIPIENMRIQAEMIIAKKDDYLYTLFMGAKRGKYYESIFNHVFDSFSFSRK